VVVDGRALSRLLARNLSGSSCSAASASSELIIVCQHRWMPASSLHCRQEGHPPRIGGISLLATLDRLQAKRDDQLEAAVLAELPTGVRAPVDFGEYMGGFKPVHIVVEAYVHLLAERHFAWTVGCKRARLFRFALWLKPLVRNQPRPSRTSRNYAGTASEASSLRPLRGEPSVGGRAGKRRSGPPHRAQHPAVIAQEAEPDPRVAPWRHGRSIPRGKRA
jgi:hypothetical protein